MKAWYGGDAIDDDKIALPWCMGPALPLASPSMDNVGCALATAWVGAVLTGSAPMGVIGTCGDWKDKGNRWYASDGGKGGSVRNVCVWGEYEFPRGPALLQRATTIW